MLINLVVLLAGFILLIKCSEYLIDSASKIAQIFKIPQFVIGFSVIAFGTSAPELIIGIITGVSKTNQITLGDILGSAIANVALVVGVAAIIKTIKIEKSVMKKEIPLSIATQILLMILLFIGGQLSGIDGLILLVLFGIFLAYIFTRSKDSMYVDEQHVSEYNVDGQNNKSKISLAVILLCSIVGVVLGGNFVVQSSTNIARALGISELLIGLTVVAIGTSLPELITTIVAILKNKSDIAIGNIIGSNIFNVLFVLGVSASIHPIDWQIGIQWDFLLMFGSTLLLILLSYKNMRLKKYHGVILLLYYLIYILLKTFAH